MWRPTDTGSIAANYRLAAGHGDLNLTQLSGQLNGRTIDVTMGAGKLSVMLPANVSVSVLGDIGVGNFTAFDERWDGPIKQTVTTPGWTPSTGLRLRLHLRVGNIEVDHE